MLDGMPDAALCCGLLLLQTVVFYLSNIVVIISSCLDAHVLWLWHLQVWLALPNREEEIRVLASISAGFAQNTICVHTMDGHVP